MLFFSGYKYPGVPAAGKKQVLGDAVVCDVVEVRRDWPLSKRKSITLVVNAPLPCSHTVISWQ